MSAERRLAELRDYLRAAGATEEDIAAAGDVPGRLAGLAADLVLTEGANLSAADLAERAGTDPETVAAMWRLLGISVPDPDEALFSERDAAFTAAAIELGTGVHGDELWRVLGSSLARVAEAAVALYVQTVEPHLDSPEADLVGWARDLGATVATALRLGDAMGTIFGHHLRDAIARQRLAQADVTERSLFRLAVGFVDLVGFTPLAQRAAPSELLELIGRFEALAFEVASRHGGRIVKHIGDEIMFIALDAGAGCAIASSLIGAFPGEGIEPRGGVVFGDVITRHGDYYGPVVNLASRLADLAIPRELLVDGATAGAATGSGLPFQPAGRRLLKGFDEPITVYSLQGPEGPGPAR
ncbi:MAG TPA: adenylate cyclase regulatory domain-containing protein [Acidimicrobiales bacterium]|nr:adenylate cyclase regulatory domain-containing protein [Acidimicrobiales bacterium]